MKIITKKEIEQYKKDIMQEIISGKLFIYPTDTIYGIGCNAEDEEAVKKLRNIKRQTNRPISVIAPSKNWIKENCEITEKVEEWLNKLPGPYTLILTLKNKNAVAESVTLNSGTLGVRIPNHWISGLIKDVNVPIITTSANITGEKFMTSYEELDKILEIDCSFMMDEGKISGNPSTLVNLANEELTIKERK